MPQRKPRVGRNIEKAGAALPTSDYIVRVTDAYFSLKTLARYSGLSVRKLRDCLTGPEPLPFYRIGGKILVRRSDFDSWAGQFRRDPAAIDAIVDDLVQGL